MHQGCEQSKISPNFFFIFFFAADLAEKIYQAYEFRTTVKQLILYTGAFKGYRIEYFHSRDGTTNSSPLQVGHFQA